MRLLLAYILIIIAIPAMAGEILLNPALEQDAEPDGIPDQWTFLRRPVMDKDSLAAFNGSASVRASVYHNLMQTRPAVSGVRYTFSGFVRGEESDEFAQLACEFFSPSQWLHYQRQYAPTALDYAPMAASFLAPPQTSSLRVNFRSLLPSYWVSGDAFSLLDEFISNPDFEELTNGMPSGWSASGAPRVNSSLQGAWSGKTQVRCNRDNYFYQDAAVFPDKKYALVFHVRTDDDSSISDSLPVAFFDNSLNLISETRIPFDAEPLYKRFLGEMIPPDDSVFMRIALRPSRESRDYFWFDAVAMAAVASSPASFSPNGDGVYDESAAVALLNESALVTLHVSDAANNSVRTLAVLANRAKGAHSFSWNGRSADDSLTTAGQYRFHFMIQSALLGDLEISTTVHLTAPPSSAAPPQNFTDTFPLGIWFHLSGRYGDDIDYQRYLSAVAARGFDTVIASWMNDARIEEFMDAADAAGVRVIAHNRAIDNLIAQKYDFAYDKVSETNMREAATSAILALAYHPSFFGYYVRDEITLEYLENARNMIRILRGADPDHPSFSAIAMTPDLPARFEKLDTDVLLHDVYPIWSLDPVSPSTFDSFCASLETASLAAIERKRPLWVILQSYGDENLRMPIPAELRCQVWLSLAYNAKGVFFFLAQSIYNLRGLFSFDEMPFPILDELSEINRDLARLASTLPTLAPAESLASAPPVHLVKSFKDSDQTPHLIVVNKDCLSTRAIELILDLQSVALVKDVLQEALIPHFYEAGRLHIPLIMPAGGGRLIRIEQKAGASNAPHRAPREAIASALSLPNLNMMEEPLHLSEPQDGVLVSFIPIKEWANNLSVGEELACVTSNTGGFRLYDVARPWSPMPLAYVRDDHNYNAASINGGRIFCADPWGGVLIYSLDNDQNLELLGERWGHSAAPYSLDIVGERAFLACGSYGLRLLDVSDPTSPILTRRGEPCEFGRHVIPCGENAYLLDEFNGIHIEDVSTSTPVRLDTLPLNRPLSGDVSRNFLAVACGDYGLNIFSIQNPREPKFKGEIALPQTDSAAFYREKYIFASAGLDGIAIIELDDSGAPHLKGFHQPLTGYYALKVVVDDPYLYVLYPYAGVCILSPDRLLNPQIGAQLDAIMAY